MTFLRRALLVAALAVALPWLVGFYVAQGVRDAGGLVLRAVTREPRACEENDQELVLARRAAASRRSGRL